MSTADEISLLVYFPRIKVLDHVFWPKGGTLLVGLEAYYD